ncbi:MAG: transposase [Proteobacteria bacterium]|nr:transposase [Pseudomonadota bacterium]
MIRTVLSDAQWDRIKDSVPGKDTDRGVTGRDNRLRIRLTPGQRHEMTQAEALLQGLPVAILIADTAFDADAFRARLAARGATAVIPSNRSRAQAVAHDPELYKERHLVECFINKIKHFRRSPRVTTKPSRPSCR